VHRQFVNSTIDDLVGIARKYSKTGIIVSNNDFFKFRNTVDALTIFLRECKKAQLAALEENSSTETKLDPDKKYITARFPQQDQNGTTVTIPAPTDTAIPFMTLGLMGL